MNNLIHAAAFQRLGSAIAAGVDGAFVTTLEEIDMRANGGFDNVCIIFCVGAIAANGVITTRVKNSDESATYGAGTIDRIGENIANDADTDDNKYIVHDIRRPKHRYVRAEYQRTVGNVTIDHVMAILYNGATCPVTQDDIEDYQVLNTPEPSAT